MYTITVSNAGPDTAQQVVIYDNLPDELIKPVYSLDNGQTRYPWTGCLNIGNLASGCSVTVQIMGIVYECAKGCLVNTAMVSSPTPDPCPSNNVDTVVATFCVCLQTCLKVGKNQK